jgi:5'-nucleotidase (lipoprotein e(P4) family)
MRKLFIILLGAMFLQACTTNPDTHKGEPADKGANSDHLMMSVLFWQKASENRALFYQAFNAARFMLEADAKTAGKEKKAVILDIDETVLDNSPYEAQCIIEGFSYPERWDEWCELSRAEACPGAIDFLNYAVSAGYEIFYVTNRKESLKDATIKNLIAQGFPMADENHVMFKTDESSKESRRQQIAETYRIAMLIGDNLGDFFDVSGNYAQAEERTRVTDSLKQEFGKRFIVLPNAMYGDWEVALYPDPRADKSVKDSIRRANLRGF